jgi:phage shock protein A
MKWIERLAAALRSAARDLISEEDTAIEEDRVGTLLAAAQTRLTVLRDELAKAIAREKQIEIEWQDALALANGLDTNVDEALRSGDDDLARAQIASASRAQIKADELAERYHACVRVSDRLRHEVQVLQREIDETQYRQLHLTDREHRVEALERLNQLKRDQRRAARSIDTDLGDRKEQIAKREDRIAAREEIDRKKIE